MLYFRKIQYTNTKFGLNSALMMKINNNCKYIWKNVENYSKRYFIFNETVLLVLKIKKHYFVKQIL